MNWIDQLYAFHECAAKARPQRGVQKSSPKVIEQIKEFERITKAVWPSGIRRGAIKQKMNLSDREISHITIMLKKQGRYIVKKSAQSKSEVIVFYAGDPA